MKFTQRFSKAFPTACLLLLAMPAVGSAAIDVVTTTPNLAALAKAVGGKHVDVTSLSLPTQDPHYVDAKPSLVLKVNRADALLAVGAGLELGWLPTLQTGARNPKIATGGEGYLACASHVRLKDIQRGNVDRSMGDIHPEGNPHFLRAPKEGLQCASAIAKKFAELDPRNEEDYRRNYEKLAQEIQTRIPIWEKRIRAFGNVKIVPYHASWTYLTDWLGLEEVDHVEPKPGIAPSPAHIARLIKTIRAGDVPLIVEEEYHPTRGPSLIAERTPAELLVLPGGARVEEGQTYTAYIEDMVSKLETALKGAKK